MRGTIANVAIEIAPDYDGIISDGLVKMATEGMEAMRKLGISLGSTQYPGTLPKGTGNSGCGRREDRFYNDLEAEILAETTGPIALETGTDEAING